MTGPPAARPATQEAAGAGPRGKQRAPKLSQYVRVVNSVWNGSGFVKRKVADRYVAQQRGAFVDDDRHQLLLDMTHPTNIAAAKQASDGYKSVNARFKWYPGISGGATVMVTESSTR